MASSDAAYPLFAAQAASGNGTAIDWPGGRAAFYAYGTFGAGTCKLQWSPDAGTTWLDVDRSGETYVTFTANGLGEVFLPTGKVRAVLTGATSPTLNASLSIAR